MTAKVLQFPGGRRAVQRIRASLAAVFSGKPGAEGLLDRPLDLPADPLAQEGVALKLEAMAIKAQAESEEPPV